MINATPKQLRRAADIQERIQSLQEELNSLLGNSGPAETAPTADPKRRKKFSAVSRAKMKAAQKARWAAIKGTTAAPKKKAKKKMSAQGLANIRAGVAKRMAAQGKAASKPTKVKRKVSAAAKAALSAAAKARWAKAKKAGKTTL